MSTLNNMCNNMSAQFTCRMPSPMKRRPESSAGERREGGREEIPIRKETQLSFSCKKKVDLQKLQITFLLFGYFGYHNWDLMLCPALEYKQSR